MKVPVVLLGFFFSSVLSSLFLLFSIRLERRDAGRIRIYHIVGEIDQELSKASLSGCVVTENRRKGGISQRFGKALSEGLARSGVITQSVISLVRTSLLEYRV
jgi:hypothetical protein